MIAQGAKEVYLGEDCFRYDPAHYLLAVVSLPVVIQIAEASIDRPFLSLRLDLEPSLVSSVMVEAGLPASRAHISARAIDVSPLEPNLLDALVRLVRLVDSPAEARVMQPLVTREIVYRLLVGAQSDRLRHLTQLGGSTTRIASAVEQLRTNYDKPLRVETIASELGMSVSGFHAQFKAVTASATRMPRISPANTSGSSANHRFGTCNGSVQTLPRTSEVPANGLSDLIPGRFRRARESARRHPRVAARCRAGFAGDGF